MSAFTPLAEPKGIPFTQYLRPNGRKSPQWIERPAQIEEAAKKFIAAGGYYESELLITGEASLTAVKVIDGEPQDIAIKIVPNGPTVCEAVDALVLESLKFIGVVNE